MNTKTPPVYSTESGRLCPDCGQPVSGCTCKRQSHAVQGDGNVRLSRETKGRKGKGVTVISGLPLPDDELKALGKQLKKLCGSGGSVKNGRLEIQGDHRDLLMTELKSRGYQVKKSGG